MLESDRARKRVKLLDAARKTFVDRGYHDTKVDDIVAAAGVAKGTFYLYFPDKRSVFSTLVYALVDRIAEGILHVDVEAPIEPQVRYNVRHVVDALMADPAMTRILINFAPGLDPAVISNWIRVNLPVNATSTTRTGLTAGSTYRFHVRAINAAGLGAQSNTLAATTVAPPAGSQFFINELRMTGGGDSYVEVVAPAGTVLDGNYKILKLNGGPNAQYAGTLENSRTFVGNPTVANMGGGMGVARVGYLGLQAGERAGYAFVRYQGTQVQVLDFVTYRGGSANAGPVTSKVPGMVGAVGPVLPYSLLGAPNTLRLVGSGCHRGYFQWALPASNGTEGAVNIGQTFTNCP